MKRCQEGRVKPFYSIMNKHDYLLRTVSALAEINTKDEETIRQYFKERIVAKNEIFLKAGQICKKIFFVYSGLIRTFHITPKDVEFTRVFIQEGQFCTVLLSFSEGSASEASFQALEDTVLLEINAEDFNRFLEGSETAKKIYLKILENFQNFQIKRIEFLTKNTALQKVELFYQEHRKLAARINFKTVSSYLQITPETYSRCLKKMK